LDELLVRMGNPIRGARTMTRLAAVFIATLVAAVLAGPAAAQSAQEVAQMRLYIQQLEERVRQLTGENERLGYEVNQLRAQLGLPAAAGLEQTGAIAPQPLPGAPPTPFPPADPLGAPPAPFPPTDSFGAPPAPLPSADQALGAPPRDLGTVSVSRDDPLISPDGVEPGGPIDLSVLAGGGTPAAGAHDPNAGGIYDPNAGGIYDPNSGVVYNPNVGPNVEFGAPVPPAGATDTQTAGLPGAPPPASALSGSPRDEYDLAYGYILTGDYDLAEESFRSWLASFPNDPQASDAQFWLGESQLQQGEFRDAANAFLAVYKSGQGTKGPDALLKLGTSLAALGEREAACATLAEVGRKFPAASPALMSRVDAEETRAGC
jgi:tol-pal system protein YbgF